MTGSRVVLVIAMSSCARPAGEPSRPDASDASDASDRSSDALPERWATYRIAVGAHVATVTDGTPTSPLAGFTTVGGRDFEFIFDPSAQYELTAPTQPEDQLDWNKLPGLSDCGTLDLSADGAMFGWRWRTDLVPRVLEVTAYANNAGVHLTPPDALVTLDQADLAAREPLRYRVSRTPAEYRFSVSGSLRGRPVAAETTLPRRCSADPLELVAWAAGFYFGGTSTAPSVITGRVREVAFVP